jgi:hypothetical protein
LRKGNGDAAEGEREAEHQSHQFLHFLKSPGILRRLGVVVNDDSEPDVNDPLMHN